MFWFYEGVVSKTGEKVKSPFTMEEAIEKYKDWKNESPLYKPLKWKSD